MTDRTSTDQATTNASFVLGVVAPLPPPAGGMANQARQLIRLWRETGQAVEVARMNPPYRPAAVARIPLVRALFRLLPYLVTLWRIAGKSDLIHVFANSGWAWHLFAAPAIWIAHWRGTPVIVNYRGGAAEEFFRKSWPRVAPSVKRVDRVVVPSGFLQAVFAQWGVSSEIVSNIIDLSRFGRAEMGDNAPLHVVSTRNLETIYDVATTIRGFAGILPHYPDARLTIAGRGPERRNLENLAAELNIARQVTFTGNLDNNEMIALYQSADAMVNTSRVDNMPISILESLACGVPVVSSDAGGIPHLVEDGKTALLVPVGDSAAVSSALLKVLEPGPLRESLIRQGLDHVQQYAWPQVRQRWLEVYRSVLSSRAQKHEV